MAARKVTHPYETGRLPAQAMLQGRYLILQLIAQGGMSAVYLAADVQAPNTRWAVKEMSYKPLHGLRADRQAEAMLRLRESFKREFEILSHSDHPNLPRAQAFFEEQGRPYIVMEYLEGQTLERILESAPEGSILPEARVLAWARQLCDVLHYLHAQQPPVIYRDLKPGNVMELAGGRTLKLFDFGIARFYKPGQSRDTLRFGTEGYLAPEAYNGTQSGPTTDIYALGAMLHQLLTNRDPSMNPFQFPPVAEINPQVTPAVAQAIEKAVRNQPELRPQTAEEMLRELFGPEARVPERPAPMSSAPPAPPPRPVAPLPQPPSPSPATPAHPVAPSAWPPPPASAAPMPLVVSTNALWLGALRRGGPGSTGTFQVIAPPSISGSVMESAAWLAVSPKDFVSGGQPVTITVEARSLGLPYGPWQPPPAPSWHSRLWRPLRAWVTFHAQHLVPGPQAHRGQVAINARGQPVQTVRVEVEINPPGWRVGAGWAAAITLMTLEAGLILSPIVYWLSSLWLT